LKTSFCPNDAAGNGARNQAKEAELRIMNNHTRAGDVNSNDEAVDRPIWGARAIGRIANLTPRMVWHYHQTGALKSIRKVGGKLVATPRALIREIAGE
jgi:hypothetical protein